MAVVERLSGPTNSLISILAERRAGYIHTYLVGKNEGFPLHHHLNVDEFIVLLHGSFVVKHGKNRVTHREIKIDTNKGPYLVVIQRRTWHTIIGLRNNSEYLVVKEFNDDMLL